MQKITKAAIHKAKQTPAATYALGIAGCSRRTPKLAMPIFSRAMTATPDRPPRPGPGARSERESDKTNLKNPKKAGVFLTHMVMI